MRLGTQTGSLINHVSSNLPSPEPEVGLGATLLGWSDRQAATVVEVLPKGIVKVQADTATRVDGLGMSDAQTYVYAPNPDGITYHFRRDPWGSGRRSSSTREPSGGRRPAGGASASASATTTTTSAFEG